MLNCKYVFALLLCVLVAECKKEKYNYVTPVDRYIKMHRVPASWQEARSKCHLEGGILASPDSQEMINVMLFIMDSSEVSRVYTGIHATYSKGDYTTVTGIPLSELDVKWWKGEPESYKKNEDCVFMDSNARLGNAECTNEYPFMCFKSPEKINAHSCRHQGSHSDYTLYNETGSCYKFHKEGRSWPAAFSICQAEDAYLAIINSERESQLLKELFAQNQPNTIPGDFHKDAASIGFTKWADNQEWFTIHGQSLAEAGFAVFNTGEPNNAGNNETCGSVWRTGLLNDHNCGRYLTFICEKHMSNEDF